MKNARLWNALLVILFPIVLLAGFAPKIRPAAKFTEKHEVGDLVIQCMDHRFHPLEDFWLKQNCGDADIIGWPGASKCLDPANQALKEAALEAIGFAIEKHGVKTVHLIHHLDCGGYGGSPKHEDEIAEKKFHRAELARAVKIIRERYSSVSVRIYFATPKAIEELVQ